MEKVANKYYPILYDDVNEDLYVFKSFDKSMTRTPHFMPHPRSYLIIWNKTIDKPELLRDLHVGKDVDEILHQSILDITHDNWDSFCERGVSLLKLIFEFYLDTGCSPPVLVSNRFMDSMKVE